MSQPDPDYDGLITLLGGVPSAAAGAPALFDRNQTATGLVNLATTRSPTVVVFCPADNNKYIYARHSLSIYPTDPLVALLGFDGIYKFKRYSGYYSR